MVNIGVDQYDTILRAASYCRLIVEIDKISGVAE